MTPKSRILVLFLFLVQDGRSYLTKSNSEIPILEANLRKEEEISILFPKSPKAFLHNGGWSGTKMERKHVVNSLARLFNESLVPTTNQIEASSQMSREGNRSNVDTRNPQSFYKRGVEDMNVHEALLKLHNLVHRINESLQENTMDGDSRRNRKETNVAIENRLNKEDNDFNPGRVSRRDTSTRFDTNKQRTKAFNSKQLVRHIGSHRRRRSTTSLTKKYSSHSSKKHSSNAAEQSSVNSIAVESLDFKDSPVAAEGSRRQARQAAGSPYFDPNSPKEIKVAIGATAHIPCMARNIGTKPVSWIRNRDLHVLTVGAFLFTTDERFSAHRDTITKDWVLIIQHSDLSDSGLYECSVPTKPVTSHTVKLKVSVPRTELIGTSEVHLEKGSSLNLTCLVHGSPSPPEFILWYHRDKLVNYGSSSGVISSGNSGDSSGTDRVRVQTSHHHDTSRSSLLVQNATSRDSGRYHCEPSNAPKAVALVHVIPSEDPAAMQTTNSGSTMTSNSLLLYLTLVCTIVTHLVSKYARVNRTHEMHQFQLHRNKGAEYSQHLPPPITPHQSCSKSYQQHDATTEFHQTCVNRCQFGKVVAAGNRFICETGEGVATDNFFRSISERDVASDCSHDEVRNADEEITPEHHAYEAMHVDALLRAFTEGDEIHAKNEGTGESYAIIHNTANVEISSVTKHTPHTFETRSQIPAWDFIIFSTDKSVLDSDENVTLDGHEKRARFGNGRYELRSSGNEHCTSFGSTRYELALYCPTSCTTQGTNYWSKR